MTQRIRNERGQFEPCNDKHGTATAADVVEAILKETGEAVKPATLRSRWRPWLYEAVGEDRVYVNSLFTELGVKLAVLFAKEVGLKGYAPAIAGSKARAWAARTGELYPVNVVPEVVPEDEALRLDNPAAAAIVVSHAGAIASQSDNFIETLSDQADRLGQLIRQTREALVAELSEIQLSIDDQQTIQAELIQSARELNALAIQRDEALRIQQEQAEKAEEARLRQQIRLKLGNASSAV